MKWFGEIGFKEEVEVEDGVWEPQVVPKKFFGEVRKDSWSEQQGSKINADLHVSNRISVVAEKSLQNNFHKIAYITFGGAKWTVSNVEKELDNPRLLLSLGSLYIEEVDEVEDDVEE